MKPNQNMFNIKNALLTLMPHPHEIISNIQAIFEFKNKTGRINPGSRGKLIILLNLTKI